MVNDDSLINSINKLFPCVCSKFYNFTKPEYHRYDFIVDMPQSSIEESLEYAFKSETIQQAKEQIGKLTLEERRAMVTQEQFDKIYTAGSPDSLSHSEIDQFGIPRSTREPYPLPTLNINTEFWPYEGGECGEGPLDAIAVMNGFKDDNFCKCLLEADIQLSNYQSHPSIKAPLSN